MKKTGCYFLVLLLLLLCNSAILVAQTTPDDGDWKARYVKKQSTGESQYMIRSGDIDNLGFGWDKGVNPFSGASTQSHLFPWTADSKEPFPYDQILLPTSYQVVDPPCGSDGYSENYDAVMKQHNATNGIFAVPLNLPADIEIKSAILMIFVDDFQSPSKCSKFKVLLNEQRAPFIERLISSIDQTGPIGKLITMRVPTEYLKIFKSDTLFLSIDDNKTGAGDGFAIDFIKILINPQLKALRTGSLAGHVIDADTELPAKNARIAIPDVGEAVTDDDGNFLVKNIPVGLNVVFITTPKFGESPFNVDIIENEETNFTFELRPPEKSE